MSKPKYCPFCGSTEIECHSIHSRFCHGCGVTCIWYGNLRDIDTEAAWNRRAELLPERDAEREKAVDINEIQRRKDAAYERGETIYNHALLRQPQVPPQVGDDMARKDALLVQMAAALEDAKGWLDDEHAFKVRTGQLNDSQDVVDAALTAYRTMSPDQQPQVPPGYALVPVKPTQEMLRAVTPPESEWVGHQSPPPGAIERWRQAHARKAAANWKAMLAAVPCACGAMTKADCAGLPSARHCGKIQEERK